MQKAVKPSTLTQEKSWEKGKGEFRKENTETSESFKANRTQFIRLRESGEDKVSSKKNSFNKQTN